LNQTVSKFQ